jgi:hypothetical protein
MFLKDLSGQGSKGSSEMLNSYKSQKGRCVDSIKYRERIEQ